MALTKNKNVLQWVDEMVALTKPDQVVWIDGSKEQLDALTEEVTSLPEGNRDKMYKLNPDKLPGCLYHRTLPNDVARVEDRTFICSKTKEGAGPTNNWMDPEEMKAKLIPLYDGVMKGRTMYVIPYSMGPIGSPLAKVGVELTDSIYVVLNMNIMTRMGAQAFENLGDTSNDFVRGLHSKADVDPEKRYIVQFPEENTIWSINSAYGGNVLLAQTSNNSKFLPQTKPDIVSGMTNEQSHGVSAFGSASHLGLSPRPPASPHLLTRTCAVRCEASYGDRVAFR